jgi:hypothetical protein
MKHIKQLPHCDQRVLHAPGKCTVCDGFPMLQEIRELWQIAFTGEKPVDLAENRWTTRGPVLPCPAEYLRGKNAEAWSGNRPQVTNVKCVVCEHVGPESETKVFVATGEHICDNAKDCVDRAAELLKTRARIVTLKSEIAQRETELRTIEKK